MNEPLDLCCQLFSFDEGQTTDQDQGFVASAVRSGYVSTRHNTQVTAFEAKLAERLSLQPENVLAINSGTAALHLALLSAGIGPGDEVIMPAISFVATAEAVRYVGATPVFVDIRSDTWTMDAGQAYAAVTDKTKAFLPVHLYGLVADMNDLRELIECPLRKKLHNLCVIEDACEALGAFDCHGRPAGTIGKFAAFSFNGNKVITSGAGGALIGEDLSLARKLASHGRDNTGFHEMIGYNYGMPALNAALGLSQLDQLDAHLLKKIRFREIYEQELGGMVYREGMGYKSPYYGAVRFQGGQELRPWSYLSSWWMTVAVFPEWDAEGLQARLQEKGIMTRRIFRPLNHFPPYADGKVHENAECLYHHGLCLPSSVLMSERDVMMACREIMGVL